MCSGIIVSKELMVQTKAQPTTHHCEKEKCVRWFVLAVFSAHLETKNDTRKKIQASLK